MASLGSIIGSSGRHRGFRDRATQGNILRAIKGQRARNRAGKKPRLKESNRPGWRYGRKVNGGGKRLTRIDRRIRREHCEDIAEPTIGGGL
jgi:hypothetical protein